jgi:lipopolysaccharide/colanic/teichoic acid biosynthesis glycosyltransferase
LIRLFDILFSLAGLIFGLPVFLVLAAIGFFDTGSPLFRQVRVGRNKRPFTLIKFRTMRLGTAHVATHLADPAAVTPFGSFLRRTKLDELPQLWNVLCGNMSLVGPRPCLFEQLELIAARERLGVFAVRPGITGLAQVSGIDMSKPDLLAETDALMVRSLRMDHYLDYLLKTLAGRGAGDRISGPEKPSGTPS